MNEIKTVVKLCMPAILVFASVFSQFSHVSAACVKRLHQDCGTVMPYFDVMGGDILEDMVFKSTSPTCNGYTFNDINSWNTNNSDGKGFYGASVQDDEMTPDTAFQVVSGLNSDTTINTSNTTDEQNYTYNDFTPGTTQANRDPGPSELAFANYGYPTALPDYALDLSQDFYGGDSGFSTCLPDYYSDAMADGPKALPANALSGQDNNVVDLSQLTGGTYSYVETQANTPLIINDQGAINPSTSITLAVDGNVFIEKNITYNDGASISDIPNLNVYAFGQTITGTDTPVSPAESKTYGNIYVGNTVTEIHGFYVAQSNDQYTAPNCAPYYTG